MFFFIKIRNQLHLTTQTKPVKTTMFIRAYLRASTKEQDVNRAREDLDQFIEEKIYELRVTTPSTNQARN